MPLISITRLRVRSWRFLPPFFVYALRSARETVAAEGNLTSKVLTDRHWTFWTMTSWTDEHAMRAFMAAGAHRIAMKKLLHWCDEASVAHWTQASSELPSWADAHRRMQQHGRPSKVDHPSPEQIAYRIATLTADERRERVYR